MNWLEILMNVLIIVLLLINTILGITILNRLKSMIRTLQRNAESNRKEVQADILDLRKELKELHIETPRALAAMRKKMLDDLDAIHDTVKKITGSDRKRSNKTRQTGTGSEV